MVAAQILFDSFKDHGDHQTDQGSLCLLIALSIDSQNAALVKVRIIK